MNAPPDHITVFGTAHDALSNLTRMLDTRFRHGVVCQPIIPDSLVLYTL